MTSCAPWISFLTVAALVLVAPGISAQPVEWPMGVGGNGHYYEVVEVALRRDDARPAVESAAYEDPAITQ